MAQSGDDASEDASGDAAPTADTASADAHERGDSGGSADADGNAVPVSDAEDRDGAAATDASAEAALSSALDAADGDPECALCSKPADYFLYEAGSVEKFVCWEHVSPHSAAVDGENARPGRPVALSL